MKILITGAAGFIGSHLVQKLLKYDFDVIGLDNINDYYDRNIKYGRLKLAGIINNIESGKKIEFNNLITSSVNPKYKFIKLDIENKDLLNKLFENHNFDTVCNLAAQAGVRYSIINPHAYINSNIIGFMNILEACRMFNVNNLSYASSSSVYGLNNAYPFSDNDNCDHPISIYAATKKSNELMAHTYSHLFNISTTGLRFFTVYGPWGRPDMALFLFAKAALKGRSIDVFNNGEMIRDFTYIDDIVDGVFKVINNPPSLNKSWNGEISKSSAPYRVYNIGNSNPVRLIDFILAIENKIGKKIKKNMMPIQQGDVIATHSDIKNIANDLNYKPSIDLQEGVNKFIDWYIDFFGYNKQ